MEEKEDLLEKVCYYFNTGRCNFGNRCRKQHLLVKGFAEKAKPTNRGGRRRNGKSGQGGKVSGRGNDSKRQPIILQRCSRDNEEGAYRQNAKNGRSLNNLVTVNHFSKPSRNARKMCRERRRRRNSSPDDKNDYIYVLGDNDNKLPVFHLTRNQSPSSSTEDENEEDTSNVLNDDSKPGKPRNGIRRYSHSRPKANGKVDYGEITEAASTSTVDDDYSKLLDDFSQILERVVRIQPKQVRTELEEKMIRKIKENGCSGD